MNKYEKWYASITRRGQNRQLDSYTESHHIIPQSLGGQDNPENLTKLTAREHFICHWLLTKIYKEGDPHWKMLNAIRIMRAENSNQHRYKTKLTSRVYNNLREKYACLQSKKIAGVNNPMYGKTHSALAKQKIREANTGRIQTKEENIRQKQAQTGKKRKPFSTKWKDSMSLAKTGKNNPMYNRTHRDSTLELMRNKATGRKQSPETVAKKANAIRGIKKQKKLCPHCNQHVAVNGYARWHGDNCKKINLS